MLLTIYLLSACLAWILIYAYLTWSLLRIPHLEALVQESVPPATWPSLSIIVPACNEAAEIESALSSLLVQDYPDLEIVVINDRSSDGTGEIIDRLAAGDQRVTPVHITSLPAGWLGKVHALQCGVQRARGEWLLFSDADIHFAPDALRHALAYAMHEQADQLALLPRVCSRGFWLGLAIRSFGLLYLYSTRAAQAHRPDNSRFIGVGAFNLVRRSAYDRTQGFEWLRLEAADDAALGMMLKQTGAVVRFAFAEQTLSLNWYPDLRAMFKGLEKNLFGAGAHYRWWRTAYHFIAAWALVMAPALALLVGLNAHNSALVTVALGVIMCAVLFALWNCKGRSSEALYLLMFPLGVLLVNAMSVNSAFWCMRNQGIDWRGTHYPLSELRAGQRLKL